jgi:hypothetical protein
MTSDRTLLLSFLIFGAVMILAVIASYIRRNTAPAGCWYAPAVTVMKNSKGETICKSYDGEYVCYSNTVTDAELKERVK